MHGILILLQCFNHLGDKSQDQRQEALSGFKTDQQDDRKYDILIATDVAGRGIDIKGVTHVINYEMPTKIENYAHRFYLIIILFNM